MHNTNSSKLSKRLPEQNHTVGLPGKTEPVSTVVAKPRLAQGKVEGFIDAVAVLGYN
jgi:hypothetical protein